MKQILSPPPPRSQILSQAASKRMEERFDRCYVWQELRRFYARNLN